MVGEDVGEGGGEMFVTLCHFVALPFVNLTGASGIKSVQNK